MPDFSFGPFETSTGRCGYSLMPKLPSLPIPGHGDLPDYDVCLPVNLRPDADRLVRHLHDLPHRRVRYCPWCGNSNVNLSFEGARRFSR